MKSKEEVKINKKDVMGVMHVFTRVPPLMLKMVVKRNKNLVKSFESQIKDYYGKLTDEEIAKIEKVMETPVPQLQGILNEAYIESGQKQLKILADPKAKDFIERNLRELELLLSSMNE
ncbi:hypothetical protein [Methanobacterium petrolearium]|uniref:hypothetical protein n=1 Tax=Methanobacterium petrolearium TaxID=710190 RepID=UPI001AE4E748|nr:hypothetical protein [Methanobacterium petrolearium]MBP1946941.1 hypothetical protein [Methanobacterium petrolearium]BDZ72078.1 hypothetical protein GCM10025861_25950 [Methanobacterium petrolearium]